GASGGGASRRRGCAPRARATNAAQRVARAGARAPAGTPAARRRRPRRQRGSRRARARTAPRRAGAADRPAAWSCCRTVTPWPAFPWRDPARRQSTRLPGRRAGGDDRAVPRRSGRTGPRRGLMHKAVIGALLPFLLSAAAATAQDPPGKRATRNWETAADGTVTMRGRVVFTDLKHDEHAKVRGHATAVLWFPTDRGGSIGENGEVEIEQGAWSVTFGKPVVGGDKPPTHVTLSSCRIDDMPVIVETEKVLLTDDAEFVFRLRAIPSLRLRVVDAETKQELDGVEVFSGHG